MSVPPAGPPQCRDGGPPPLPPTPPRKWKPNSYMVGCLGCLGAMSATLLLGGIIVAAAGGGTAPTRPGAVSSAPASHATASLRTPVGHPRQHRIAGRSAAPKIAHYLEDNYVVSSWYKHITGFERSGLILAVSTDLPQTGTAQALEICKAITGYSLFNGGDLEGFGGVDVSDRDNQVFLASGNDRPTTCLTGF